MYNFVHHNISVALTKQTYNTQDRNPKTNTRNPKSKSSKNSLVTSSRQEMDWVYSKKTEKMGQCVFTTSISDGMDLLAPSVSLLH